MLSEVFDLLNCRRVEWKCDALMPAQALRQQGLDLDLKEFSDSIKLLKTEIEKPLGLL